MTALLGNGIYTFRDASRLTGLRVARIRGWFRQNPFFRSDYEVVDRDFAMSFYDLVDVFVAGQLRERGVSTQTIRKVYARMTEDLGGAHPFCREELVTDGKIVFLRNAGADEPQFVEVLTKQGVFSEVIFPFLKNIEYDKIQLLAKRWNITESVIIDPQICYGSPIVHKVGIPTSILANAYEANNKNASLVAGWYGIDEASVLVATQFERRFAA